MSIRWDCAKNTDALVAEKFTLPLNFDKKTKDELRGFWYYSYYRQCLYQHGFDFHGNPVPASTLSAGSVGTLYTNPYAHLQFQLPAQAVLLTDNELRVDFDDRLFVSKIQMPTGDIQVDYYIGNEDFQSIADITDHPEKIEPLRTSAITHLSTSSNPQSIELVSIKQQNGFVSIVFMTPQKNLVHILAPSGAAKILEMTAQSLSFTP